MNVGSAGKDSACSAGDLDSIPGMGRSPEEGKGYPLQYSGLENSIDFISMRLQRTGYDGATFTFTFPGITQADETVGEKSHRCQRAELIVRSNGW